jgi:hypothetical protein
MANVKVTELSALSLGSITGTDLFVIVDDVSGVPTTKKVTFDNVHVALSKFKSSSPTIQVITIPVALNLLTLDFAQGNVFTVSLNANITAISIVNASSISNMTLYFYLIFTMDGTARTVTWPASVSWAQGTSPVLSSANGNREIFSFLSTNGGTNWLGFAGGQFGSNIAMSPTTSTNMFLYQNFK